mmetsp:Transcript_9481/g.23161  ORF Transcript_9481/g.23161 Transcript_9481/m.23161 type:complete len:229 (-) Transcript_9481:190-876(-)
MLVHLICDIQLSRHCGPESFLVYPEGRDDLVHQLDALAAQTHTLYECLLGHLQITVISAAQPRDDLLHLLLQTPIHSSVGPHDLEEVIVFLLRHDRRTRHKLVRQREKCRLLLCEHHHVDGKAGHHYHALRQRLQNDILKVAAAEATIQRVRLQPLKPQGLGRHLPVQLQVGDAETSSRSERVLVDLPGGGLHGYGGVTQSTRERPEPQADRRGHRLLHVCISGHEHI